MNGLAGDDILTMKLAGADGEILWVDHDDGPFRLGDRGWAIAIGPDDHPVVTGIHSAPTDPAFFRTLKLDNADGSEHWRRSVAGADNFLEREAGWLAVCDNGDIVMMNRTWELATGYDVVLHRYAADDGSTVWATRYNSAGNTPDDPTHMVRDAAGDLLVAGVRSGNFMALKIDQADGELLWSADWDGPAGGYDAAAAIAEGPGGDVIVTGFSTGAATSWDVTTVAFDPADGALRWEQHFDGGEGRTDEGKALAVSPQGDLYVTGYCDLATTATDLVALRYLPTGPTGVDGPLAGTPAPPPLRISADPNPFVLGLSFSVEIPQAGPARLAVYDVRGRQVALLHDGALARGTHRIGWNGRGDAGAALGSGVYFVRLESAGQAAVRKLVRTR